MCPWFFDAWAVGARCAQKESYGHWSVRCTFRRIMARVGHVPRRLLAAPQWQNAHLACLFALLLMATCWGFVIDDALISVRYACNLAHGLGYRFNAGSMPSDGVTPMPWLLVLLPFSGGGTAASFLAARLLGGAATLAGAAVLASRFESRPSALRAIFFGLLPLPVCMHATSGMETGFVTGLGFCAVAALTAPAAYALIPVITGVAAAFRPELLPWALVLSVGIQISAPRALLACAIPILPFALVSCTRLALFGRLAPLALAAKPGDVAQGLTYAGAAIIVSVTPLMALLAFAHARSRLAFVALAAGFTHFAAIAMAGGDWMPFARLAAPVLPTFAWVLAQTEWRSHLRIAAESLGTALMLLSHARFDPGARRVAGDRERLAASASAALGQNIAAIDIGWLTLASKDAHILDLAGATDAEIAFLPGSHTSKRVPYSALRKTDTLLLYANAGAPSFQSSTYARALEDKLAHDPETTRDFAQTTWLPLTETHGYWVLRKRR
jgi:hypothetical protein